MQEKTIIALKNKSFLFSIHQILFLWKWESDNEKFSYLGYVIFEQVI